MRAHIYDRVVSGLHVGRHAICLLLGIMLWCLHHPMDTMSELHSGNFVQMARTWMMVTERSLHVLGHVEYMCKENVVCVCSLSYDACG